MSTSPFLMRPRSEWVASNDLAFAIRDRYPVTPRHTLIVPHRLVATWFEATRAEQIASDRAAGRGPEAIEAEFHPDGYDVGFNAGEAAGQTVKTMR